MMNKEKENYAISKRKSRRNPDGEINTMTRGKQYTLNERSAMDKKLNACDRPGTFEEKSGNFCYTTSTAGFEVMREALFNYIHLPHSGSSRQLEYITDQD